MRSCLLFNFGQTDAPPRYLCVLSSAERSRHGFTVVEQGGMCCCLSSKLVNPWCRCMPKHSWISSIWFTLEVALHVLWSHKLLGIWTRWTHFLKQNVYGVCYLSLGFEYTEVHILKVFIWWKAFFNSLKGKFWILLLLWQDPDRWQLPILQISTCPRAQCVPARQLYGSSGTEVSAVIRKWFLAALLGLELFYLQTVG